MDERSTTRHRHRLAVPAVLAGLAFAVPMAAAAGPGLGYHRTAAAAVTSDRAEQLMQYVSEAARQFCASQPAVAPVRPQAAPLLPPAPATLAAPPTPTAVQPPTHAVVPQLIDLPPPLG